MPKKEQSKIKFLNKETILSLKTFLILWLGQSLSQFGSAMTSFALIIWAYKKQGTVMSISMLSVCSYLPYAIVSILAGAIIDRFKKKKIMLICETIAFMCSLCAFILMFSGKLEVWHLYIINAVCGFMNAFESPALKVLIKLIVKSENYNRVSGMQSLSSSMSSILTPTLATMIISLFGMDMIFVIDLITYVIGFFSLLFLVKVSHVDVVKKADTDKPNFIRESFEGFSYLNENRGFLYLLFSIAAINYIAGIAFYSVLPAMVLARTSDNEKILGLVTGAIGAGGLIGGFLVTVLKPPKSNVKAIFISGGLSFLLCDLFLGIGQNPFVWILAGFIGNLPIPFFQASENSLLYSKIPTNIQGRIFSILGCLNSITTPIGYLTGGFLADKVFEPLMINSENARYILGNVVGVGKGSGMAIIFIITGILGFTLSVISYNNKTIRDLDNLKECN